MKIPNKRELQQTAINHSSDFDFKDFMNLYKKCTVKPYSFLVNNTLLASGNPLTFRRNLLERRKQLTWQLTIRLEMKNCNAILMGKQQQYRYYHQAKLINMNILQGKKLIYSTQLNLHILLREKLSANKHKQLKIKE